MSDEVSQFLEQVERLRGQQIEDDEVRAREREEFLAAKRERQARREERARSISPQKSSPANTPSPRSNRRTVHLSDALRLDSPSGDNIDKLREQSAEPEKAAEAEPQQDAMSYSNSSSKENEAPGDVDVKRNDASTAPSRASGLTWQRRTNRSNSRPLSVVAAQNATQRSLTETNEPQNSQEPSSPNRPISKEQIAQSLGSKDPSWFRQTADRGKNSAAYRKDQVEDNDRLDMSAIREQLPGMSTDTPKETVRELSSETLSERTASRSGASTPGLGKLASPLPLNPPRFDNPAALGPESDSVSATASGRTSPIRSTSPTKGMGGFVQSAMMKRSDSVKRWSVASPPGLTRADSIAANRVPAPTTTTTSRPQSVARERSTTPGTSRPTSRHTEKETFSSDTTLQEPVPKTPTKTSPPLKQPDDDASLPVSPTKTMEPRRWSPTKSSWLESALNKPESPPKPQHKSTPSQPSWMVELNKNKAERASNTGGDRPAASHRHQVSIDGLMRSSPMGGGLNLNTTGLGGIYSPPAGGTKSATIRTPVPNFTAALANPVPEPEKPKPKAKEPEEVKEQKVEEAPAAASSQTAKSKPEAPPKKDFRANLKPRAAEAPVANSNEPEFKSVFGTLRRTKTQNFKAPDELKDNILRGKAALAVTDGPQKSTIKDEFKDAILKKKDDFKKVQSEGKGVATTLAMRSEKPKPIPEGLARRAELGRHMTGPKKDSTSISDKRSPSGQSKKLESPRPTPPKRKSSQINLARQSSPSLTPTKSPSTEMPGRDLTGPDTPTKAEAAAKGLPGLMKKKSAPSKLGGIADRFNPALAGMLARGPPPAAPNGQGAEKPRTASNGAELPKPGPQLTHMTKSRARGPKRKAPSNVGNPTAGSKDSFATPAPAAQQSAASATRILPSLNEEKKPTTHSIQEQVAAKAAVRSKIEPPKPNGKSTDMQEAHRPEPLNFRRRPTDSPTREVESPLPQSPLKEADSPRKLDLKRMSKFLDQSHDSRPEPVREPVKLAHQRTGSRSPVKAVAAHSPEPVKEPITLPRQRTGSTSPIKRSERPLPDPRALQTTSDKQPSTPVTMRSPPVRGGSASKAPPTGPKPTSFSRSSSREVESPKETPGTPIRPLPRPPTTSNLPSPLASPSRIPVSASNDVTALLRDFFGSPLERKPCTVDPADILTNYPKFAGRIKTLSFHMFQIDGDGKQTQLQAHHERILFEQEMYVAAHNFTNEAGWKVREVYFWVGDGVSEGDVSEAESAAQQEAKSLGGKLIQISQGKETPEFVQALGGVVIVRRGSSLKYDSLAPVMLCGRRYLGQVAFDEVDLGTASLCAGFAYLIAHSGNCYLWKGKGSDVDELSCARLIGMDLTVTGALIEYDEGDEPASFWQLLEGGAKPHSADHWRLKPSYGKYCSRLFCSDADSRQQIYEISPFNQSDMSPSGIYILDAFFEMYIIVGSHAQSQYASFRNALDFAQEYAVFAASMEDRPFIPISTVVLEGAPRDFKRVFRKWSDDLCPTVLNVSSAEPGLKRGRSLRVVPLTQALLALKG